VTEELLSPQAHWDAVYGRRDPGQLSWHEPAPEISLALITQAGVPRDAGIIDVGGGTSGLASALLASGYTEITVADISAASLEAAQASLSPDARRIHWIQADARSHDFGRRYQLWHDRAVFHFMVTTPDREAYLDNLRRTLAADGCVVLATFGPAGPTQCSGLPTRCYDAPELIRLLGPDFDPLASRLHQHTTPAGAQQQFLYLLARRTPRTDQPSRAN
jgi:ubiquinone/menaquinone biosynthesis C-methylase UbiE